MHLSTVGVGVGFACLTTCILICCDVWSESDLPDILVNHSQPGMMEILSNLPAVKTIRRSPLSDYLVAVLIISVMYLYFPHQSDNPPPASTLENTINIDHEARLHKRRERVREVCRGFNNSLRLEHNALYHQGKVSHPCTGTHFTLNHRNHFICNVLKAGSTLIYYFRL